MTKFLEWAWGTAIVIAILLIGSYAHAQYGAQFGIKGTLPPAEFDKPYTGNLWIVYFESPEDVFAACHGESKSACISRPKNAPTDQPLLTCTIMMLSDFTYRKQGRNPAVILRHELGHCNGWMHPTRKELLADPSLLTKGQFGRLVADDQSVAMPVLPPSTKRLPTSSASSPICVTPEWKEEPCKSRQPVS
jgi:hypothetical protein